jgi:hypothetical protein
MKEIIIDGIKYIPETTQDKRFHLGGNYYIRTYSYHYVGTVSAIEKIEDNLIIFIKNGSWIADSGRLTDALRDGFETLSSSEIEPIENIEFGINFSAIESIIPYKHNLPTKQK